MQDLNRKVRQLHVRIELGDRGIVPDFYFAEKNICHHGPGKLELASHIGQLVDHDNSNEHGGQLENRLLRGAELSFGDGSVASAKIAGTCQHVPRALRGAHCHVPDFRRRLLLVVRLDPVLVERLRHAGAGLYQHHFFLASNGRGHKNSEYDKSDKIIIGFRAHSILSAFRNSFQIPGYGPERVKSYVSKARGGNEEQNRGLEVQLCGIGH